MLFRTLSALAFLICFAPLAGATESADAAGRIDFNASGGSCSGALVAPGIVVTAAHCTPSFESRTALPDVEFVPGAGSVRARVTGAARHPLYDMEGQRVEWKFRFDMGVVRLADADALAGIEPFPLGDDARKGETLYIVSWRRGEGSRPRQRACPVLSTSLRGLVTLGCSVASGESGAPVLRKTDAGLELVAIISSRSQLLDQPVAQASNVRLRLPPLLDRIAADPGS